MSDKMREEFENEYAKIHSTRVSFDKGSYFSKDGAGCYIQNDVYSAYYWWVKSRENIVVDLPDPIGYPLTYHEALVDVEEALDNVGVSYK